MSVCLFLRLFLNHREKKVRGDQVFAGRSTQHLDTSESWGMTERCGVNVTSENQLVNFSNRLGFPTFLGRFWFPTDSDCRPVLAQRCQLKTGQKKDGQKTMEHFEWNANNFDQSEVKRCPEGENSNKETNKHKPTSADLFFQNQCNWRCNGVRFTLWQHSDAKAPRNLEIWNDLSNRFILLFSGWTFVSFSGEFCCSNFAKKNCS